MGDVSSPHSELRSLLDDSGFAAEAVRRAGLVACAEWIDLATEELSSLFEQLEAERQNTLDTIADWKTDREQLGLELQNAERRRLDLVALVNASEETVRGLREQLEAARQYLHDQREFCRKADADAREAEQQLEAVKRERDKLQRDLAHERQRARRQYVSWAEINRRDASSPAKDSDA